MPSEKQKNYISFLSRQLGFKPTDRTVDGVNVAYIDFEEKMDRLTPKETSHLIDLLKQAYELGTEEAEGYAEEAYEKINRMTL